MFVHRIVYRIVHSRMRLMPNANSKTSGTFIEAVKESLTAAGRYNSGDSLPPEECPEELKPLVELQYRGAVWTQLNGKDWTIEAFLMSENGGLGLEVGRDNATRNALLGALDTLATTPISTLRVHKLEAEDFDK